MRREAFLFVTVALGACAHAVLATSALAGPHDALIAKHAVANNVPEQLVRRVIRIESRGNAAAAHGGNFGLMQIRLATARGVGYAGDAQGLLDPDTNLTYAVKYLAGAYRMAGCDADRAVSYYMRGYYGAAQRNCAEASSQATQLAQAEPKPAAKNKRDNASPKVKPEPKLDAATAKPADVIKPKVVRTESIAPPQSGSGPAPARPAGNFEPTRIAPPPVQPVAANPMPANTETAPNADMIKPATTEPAAKFELASVPLPPVRPELDAAPKQKLQPIHRSGRAHDKAAKKLKPGAKSKIATRSKTDSKSKATPDSKIDDPVGVVTFLKKLVTPDTKSRKRAGEAEADADPPSHVQPPQ